MAAWAVPSNTLLEYHVARNAALKPLADFVDKLDSKADRDALLGQGARKMHLCTICSRSVQNNGVIAPSEFELVDDEHQDYPIFDRSWVLQTLRAFARGLILAVTFAKALTSLGLPQHTLEGLHGSATEGAPVECDCHVYADLFR